VPAQPHRLGSLSLHHDFPNLSSLRSPRPTSFGQRRSGNDPFFLAELRESYAILHKHQPYADMGVEGVVGVVGGVGGWCTLWLKDHHEHLGLLDRERQSRLAEDVSELAAAMHRALPSLRRINYECLGNVVAHIHWHLIPRFEWPIDPDPGATVWVRPPNELECGVTDSVRDDLIQRLRAELQA